MWSPFKLITASAVFCTLAMAEVAKPEVRGCRLEKEVVKLELVDGAYSLMEAVAQFYNGTKDSVTRAEGTEGYSATYRYISLELNDLKHHYTISHQYFLMPHCEMKNHTVVWNDETVLNSTVFSCSPPGGTCGKVAASFNYGCSPLDYPKSKNWVTYVAKRGKCSYLEKSKAAYEADAFALLVYDDSSLTDPRYPLKGSLGSPVFNTVPVFGISANDAKALLGKKDQYVTTQVESSISFGFSGNIFAASKTGDKSNVVMVGANMDSTENGPGVNDNLSGVVSLLKIAKYLTKFKLNNAVKFAWWGGGTNGAYGSMEYALNEDTYNLMATQVYLDANTLASPNHGYLLPMYSPVSKHFGSYFSNKGIPYTQPDFGVASDNLINDLWIFDYMDIPTGGTTTGKLLLKDADAFLKFGGTKNAPYDKCNGLRCDDLSNLNIDVWYNMTKAYAYLIGNYSNSVKYLPENPGGVFMMSNMTIHLPGTI